MGAFNREGSLRLPPRPWPWERRVTVCIAAACTEGGAYEIVLCSDWRASTIVGNSDSMLKHRLLPAGFRLLTSGIDTDIKAGEILIRQRLSEALRQGSIDETNIRPIIQAALFARRQEKTEQYVRGRFSISHDTFLKQGKVWLSSSEFESASREISDIKLGASFIVAGFLLNFVPLIAETTETCDVLLKEGFSAIGEGSLLAYSSLIEREHSDGRPLNRTIYAVYEAKLRAERIGSVGPSTTIGVLHPDGTFGLMKNEKIASLKAMYSDRFGPKSIDGTTIDIPPDWFRKITAEAEKASTS